MPSLLETAGAQPRNPSHGKPVHVARMETGLVTNRSPLHDPASFIVSKFYGGYVDALWSGNNFEVSNFLTLIRRPGNSQWTSATYPTAPKIFYEWQRLDGTIQIIVDTATTVYRDNQNGTLTTILVKSSPGGSPPLPAGQAYFQGVGDWLYIGDGVDLVKYDGTNVWNWGIASPIAAPTLSVVNSASASQTWVLSTVFSTMGLLVDSTGNIQQLISVNALGTNSTQFGSTGNGQPAWNQTPGNTSADNGWNWSNWGPIVAWTPSTVYNNVATGGTLANPCIIYDPNTKCCFYNAAPSSAQGTSGTSYPNFPAAPGANIHDPANQDSPPAVKWYNLGSLKVPPAWTAAHSYQNRPTASDYSLASIVEPVNLVNGLPTNQKVFWQVNNTGSTQTSGSGGTAPPWNTVLGSGTGTQTSPDGALTWLSLGSGTRATNHTYIPWTAMGATFSVIVDSNNNFQVCTTGGISSATATGSVAWQTGYGQVTVDGTVTWTCVGAKMTWVANTSWFLPATGWFPPSGSVPYGGSLIIDSNNNVQAVTTSGKTSTVHPTWITTPIGGVSPTDGAAIWTLVGPFNTLGFSWTKGMSYAVSYGSRTLTDIYNSTVPPDWPSTLGQPTGAKSGGISTASPLATITGGDPGAVVNLSIPCSSDPQVDTIFIWRTLDGGSTLFLLTEVPNIQPIGGVPQFQHVQDVSADSVINEFISAPIDHTNDPPPAGFLPMAYHFERIWGAVGQFVYCTGGGDVVTGNPNESINPDDFFEFPSPCVRLVPTSTGILNFTTNNVQSILGGPNFVTFFPSPAIPGVGLLNFGALDIHGGVIYLFSADRQALTIDPSGGVNRIGGAVADKLALFDPTKACVTVHENGNDNAIFVGDGSTGWYRLNPNQFPNGNAVWSPFATITGGAGVVQSIEVAKGDHRLLIGPTGTNGHILQRDLTTWQDGGVSYTCDFEMGNINIVNPGQIAGLTFVNIRATKVGTTPTVGFLLNEISGTFTTFPVAQAYPWQIFGATAQPTSLYSNAYYFRDTGVPALCEHLQVKVSFPAENFPNEVLSLTIWGSVEEPSEL
jgi:hypothetical protein